METKLIHIAPFDIGCSFFDYDYLKKNSKDDFTSKLRPYCISHNYTIIDSPTNKFFFSVKLNENIICHLLECGVGVFVIENLDIADLTTINSTFNMHFECELYYKKKIEQKAIKDQLGDFQIINLFMNDVWKSVDKKARPYSACEKYKHKGLSYVLSIYHIIETNNASNKFNHSLDLLMNPSIMNKVCDNSQWNSIVQKIKNYKDKGFQASDFSDVSKVASSWSAVAFIETSSSNTIDDIINYEIVLQASWFLFDCLIDNIKNNQMNNLELQKEKSLATNVSLEVSNILSANMSTSQKDALEIIYQTSGFEILKDKLFLLLENRIAIVEAKISQRQGIYGIITEILLVLFTLVSIYEPIRNVVNGTLKTSDMIIGIVMIIVLIVCSILIIGKEK